ncbi:MAG: UDP-glucose 4-epimerase GalE [Candidatus Cloacimonetes bacterium]|nr:UDP-glucose 4-epimerase GalE [Candidatus Cloacimonadota bacterium]
MKLLITGGAGYIGSHTCVVLLEAGHDIAILDDLSNSSREAVRRVEELAGKAVAFHQVDLLDEQAVRNVMAIEQPDGVIHFAGRKAVGESVEQPLLYYRNNVTGTLNLLQAMQDYNVRTLVFSSSATVYGEPDTFPITEDAPLNPANPYGRTKLMIERICIDLVAADPSWRVSLLRYFNPVGAHLSGRIGEAPDGPPNNLLPFIAQVAVGRREELSVFGDDWPTPDGTGVRDYIHVMDLADGHAAALNFLADNTGLHIHSLGTGRGYSVLEVIAAFESASGRRIAYRIASRRAGDIPTSWADPGKARRELGWQATRNLDAMCADAWRWQLQNPQGYPKDTSG